MYSEFLSAAQGSLWDGTGMGCHHAECSLRPFGTAEQSQKNHCGVTASADNEFQSPATTFPEVPLSKYIPPLLVPLMLENCSGQTQWGREKTHFSGKTILVLEQTGINVLCINLVWKLPRNFRHLATGSASNSSNWKCPAKEHIVTADQKIPH